MKTPMKKVDKDTTVMMISGKLLPCLCKDMSDSYKQLNALYIVNLPHNERVEVASL